MGTVVGAGEAAGRVIAEMAAEIVRLRAALAFYQGPWDMRHQDDRGRLAREALEQHLDRKQ